MNKSFFIAGCTAIGGMVLLLAGTLIGAPYTTPQPRNIFLSVPRSILVPQSPSPLNLTQSFAPVGANAAPQGVHAVSLSNGIYTFTYRETPTGAPVSQYRIDTNDAAVRRGALKVEETIKGTFPVTFAGTLYRKLDDSIVTPRQIANQPNAAIVFTHAQWPNNIVSFSYTETIDGVTTSKRYGIQQTGRTLAVHVYATGSRADPRGNYSGITFDSSAQTPNPQDVSIPYMEAMPVTLTGPATSRFFYSTYIDYALSNSNAPLARAGPTVLNPDSFVNSYEVAYIAGQNNVYPRLDEQLYITVSDRIEHLFPQSRFPVSVYRTQLVGRAVWDAWSKFDFLYHPLFTFLAAQRTLEKLATFIGENELLILYHVWQYLGYDCGLPRHYPASWLLGGDDMMRGLTAAARRFGYLFALHENYVMIDEIMLYRNRDYIARNPDGTLQSAGTTCGGINPRVPAYTIAIDKSVVYARQESRLIRDDYGTTAAYVDVSTSQALAGRIDYSSANPNARTYRDALRQTLNLHGTIRSIHGGPLLGEGRQTPDATTFFQAGVVDGEEGEIVGREFAQMIPDFTLRYVKPLRIDHGMGIHGRWIGNAPTQVEGLNVNTFPHDKYRAQEIIYARAAFLGDNTFSTTQPMHDYYRYWAKEFYTLIGLQKQYLASPVREILYRSQNGEMVNLDRALRERLNFQDVQIKIVYENGLEIWVNHHPTAIWNVVVNGRTYYLPPYGWVAFNGRQNDFFLTYSALVNSIGEPDPTGYRVDYVKSWSDYIMVDGRGRLTNFGRDLSGNSLTASRLKVVKQGWVLEEQPDGELKVTNARLP